MFTLIVCTIIIKLNYVAYHSDTSVFVGHLQRIKIVINFYRVKKNKKKSCFEYIEVKNLIYRTNKNFEVGILCICSGYVWN